MNKNELLTDTFKWLFIGLLVCFGISYLTCMNDNIYYMVYGGLGRNTYILYIGLEIALCLVLSIAINKLSPLVAKLLYLAYTALTGITLSSIFLIYTGSSIVFVFLATAIIFGIFAIIGKTTKMDLSKWGVFLLVALIAIIILELINLFVMNNTLDMILCIVVILVFAAYTAYDVNRLVNGYNQFNNQGIYFALQLFLDFINIFIKLLRLLGKRND